MRSAFAALVPAARFVAELLWIVAKAVFALTAWFLCVGLVGYWMLWLGEAIALEGIAAGVVDVLLCALWLALAIPLAVWLECWVDGERWRDWYGNSLAYKRPDYTPDSEKS